jgi:lipid II:glycine glycyltransferase (peptidoglycan interpeptide bridge formation enzyme)
MGTGDGRFPSSGVFQELIQNADDAGARTVTFLYDQHTYGTKSLHHPDLAAFQGPHLTWNYIMKYNTLY